jgi:hypothetical protein
MMLKTMLHIVTSCYKIRVYGGCVDPPLIKYASLP